MKKTIVFRLLALSQLAYESGCYARDALRRKFGKTPATSVVVSMPDGPVVGEMQVVRGLTLTDLRHSGGELFRNCILRGHVNLDLFRGVSTDNYPELRNKDAIADNRRLLRVVMDHVWRIATMGAERSGSLIPYVASQHEHLSECQHCIDTVLQCVREDVRTRESMDRLLQKAGFIRGSTSALN